MGRTGVAQDFGNDLTLFAGVIPQYYDHPYNQQYTPYKIHSSSSALNLFAFPYSYPNNFLQRMSESDNTEFWEKSFQDKQEMWGMAPARSAILTNRLFVQKGIKNVLIPGIGYGRNAQTFRDNGMHVTGIEISQTAIDLMRKNYSNEIPVYKGSVTDMPFDEKRYDGIFCYAVIHLLDAEERAKLIRDCYNQLSENGYMAFAVISKKAPTYGTGKSIGKDRFEQFGGVNLFFYDEESIREEFGPFGLLEVTEIEENLPFFLVTCKKA